MRLKWITVIGALTLGGLAPEVWAAPQPRALFPQGVQRGATVEVTAPGKYDVWPIGVWVDRPGIEVRPLADQGKLSIHAAPDAPCGVYWLRMYDSQGAAPPLSFVVGQITEVTETDGNDTVAAAQVIDAAAPATTINGRLERTGDVDVFAVTARAGQTLVADIDAQSPLGSPVDVVLQVLSPQGDVVAQNEDQLGLDPRLAVTVPAEGRWHVRVFGFPATPDSSIALAGNERYVYRLTLSTAPTIDYTWPLAVSASGSRTVELHGWNLTDALRSADVVETSHVGTLQVAPPGVAKVFELPLVMQPSLVETEPNNAESPQAIELPATITGRIEPAQDVDSFAVNAAAGETLVARIESRGLGFDLDPVLTWQDESGKVLATLDDLGDVRDPELGIGAPAAGRLLLKVTDLHRAGGERFVYRLSIQRAVPDVRLTCEAHAGEVVAGATLDLPVAIERLHGFTEPITVTVTGLPEGITAAEVVSQPTDDSAKKIVLRLSASEAAAISSTPIRVEGRVGERQVPARITVPDRTAELFDYWLTVTRSAK